MKYCPTVLFMARYAPNAEGVFQNCDSLHKTYAQYHKDIYNILKMENIKLVSSNNPSDILDLSNEIEYVFSLYNRMPFRNSEVFISSVAEYHGVGYLGSSPNIRALAEDKHLGKMMARHANVPTSDWAVFSQHDLIEQPTFDGPYFVKPRFGAASEHITEKSLCMEWGEAKVQIESLLLQNTDVILEQYIEGVYHTSPILGNYSCPIALPCIGQKSTLRGNVVSYHQKRKAMGGLERYVVTDAALNQKLQQNSLSMFKLVQPLDYTRFDYIVADNGNLQFLEFNVCCNLGRHSTISQAANYLGHSYENVIRNILHSSLHRWGLPAEMSHKL